MEEEARSLNDSINIPSKRVVEMTKVLAWLETVHHY